MSTASGGALVAICAAKSGGVTTATLALARAWPRPVLVAEVDPAGADVAAASGRSATPGLLSLAAAARTGMSAELVLDALQVMSEIPVLLGPSSAEAAGASLSGLGVALADQLCGLVPDALADCGRLTPGSPVANPFLSRAALVVVISRSSPEALVATRYRLSSLPAHLLEHCMVVLVGDRPYGPDQASEFLPAPVLGALAEDQRAARAILEARAPKPARDRSALARSARPLAAALAARLEQLVSSENELAAASTSPNGSRP